MDCQRLGARIAADEEIHRDVGEIGNLQRRRIAHHHGACRNRRSRLARKRQGLTRPGDERRLFVAQRNVRCADLERRGAEGVRDDDAHAAAADARVHDLPQRLVARERHAVLRRRIGRRRGRRGLRVRRPADGRRGPRPDPVFAAGTRLSRGRWRQQCDDEQRGSGTGRDSMFHTPHCICCGRAWHAVVAVRSG